MNHSAVEGLGKKHQHSSVSWPRSTLLVDLLSYFDTPFVRRVLRCSCQSSQKVLRFACEAALLAAA